MVGLEHRRVRWNSVRAMTHQGYHPFAEPPACSPSRQRGSNACPDSSPETATRASRLIRPAASRRPVLGDHASASVLPVARTSRCASSSRRQRACAMARSLSPSGAPLSATQRPWSRAVAAAPSPTRPYHVRGPQVLPMLGGEVEEREQRVGVLAERRDCLRVFQMLRVAGASAHRP